MSDSEPPQLPADPETVAAMREAFGVPDPAESGPADIDLEDVALGLFSLLTPEQREQFRLIWARLCATTWP